MGLNHLINTGLEFVIKFGTDILMPTMLFVFFLGLAVRLLINYTIKRHEWFAGEFEKRVNKYLEDTSPQTPASFFMVTKRLLERTYYEIFEVRGIMKRRKPDVLMDKGDRFFLIKQGVAWFVRDITRQVQHLKFNRVETQPKLLNISKTSMARNPAFNKLFGVIPLGPLNDMLNIMPGMFVIGGIFGTFLGIMQALPSLGGMDLANAEQSKVILDKFLIDIAFSMNTSILGIILSVFTSFFNTAFSPDKAFSEVVEHFEHTLDLLWHRSTSNDLPQNIAKFDENVDPIDALAAQSIEQELTKNSAGLPPVSTPKAS